MLVISLKVHAIYMFDVQVERAKLSLAVNEKVSLSNALYSYRGQKGICINA